MNIYSESPASRRLMNQGYLSAYWEALDTVSEQGIGVEGAAHYQEPVLVLQEFWKGDGRLEAHRRSSWHYFAGAECPCYRGDG